MDNNELDNTIRKMIIFFISISLLLVPIFGIFPIVILFISVVQLRNIKNKQKSLGKANITWTELWNQITNGWTNNSRFEDLSDLTLKKKVMFNGSSTPTNNKFSDDHLKRSISVNNTEITKELPYQIETTNKKWLVVIFVLLTGILVFLWLKNNFITPINF